MSAPTVTITSTGTGTGAAATSLLGVASITVTAAGSGYTSAPTVTIAGSTSASAAPVAATCNAANGLAQTGGAVWQPPVITVPTGNSLTINLTNNLTFQPPIPAGSTTAPSPNSIPTSLTIVGQLGGGLGTPTTVASPAHTPQTVITWSTQGAPIGPTGGADSFNPPAQGPRVQSFGTEVEATAGSNTRR